MKYLVAATISLSLATLLSGCMMMMGGMKKGSDDESGGTHSGGGMMKCGMMMGGGMKHSSKDKKEGSSGGSMKCGSDMKMDGKSKDMKHSEDMSSDSGNTKSYVIAQRYCTQCHDFREASSYSKEEWGPILSRMLGYMQDAGRSVPDNYESVMIEHYYGVNQ